MSAGNGNNAAGDGSDFKVRDAVYFNYRSAHGLEGRIVGVAKKSKTPATTTYEVMPLKKHITRARRCRSTGPALICATEAADASAAPPRRPQHRERLARQLRVVQLERR